MNIIIDISRDDEGGFLYSFFTETEDGRLTLVGSGQENTLDAVFQNLQSLTERTI